MVAHGNDHLVIFGVSQGAVVVNVVKRKLAEQYPAGTKAPDIDFVLAGDPNLPNGGLCQRFAGLYIPILDLSFNGSAPTDTQFATVEINREYDGFSRFAVVSAQCHLPRERAAGHRLLAHVHPRRQPARRTQRNRLPTRASMATPTTTSSRPDLPLFGPLRTLGVPESLIDVVEPFFKVIVDLGYDRSIPAWEPTPARLFPRSTRQRWPTISSMRSARESITLRR